MFGAAAALMAAATLLMVLMEEKPLAGPATVPAEMAKIIAAAIGIVVETACTRLACSGSKITLELRQRLSRPIADIGYGNPGLDIMLWRIDMAIADRSGGRDGHVERLILSAWSRLGYIAGPVKRPDRAVAFIQAGGRYASRY